MLMRLAKVCITAVLLLLAGMPGSAAVAKPPVLPNESKDACLEKAPQQEIHSQLIVEGRQVDPLHGNRAKSADPFLLILCFDSDSRTLSAINPGRSRPEVHYHSLPGLGEIGNQLFRFLSGNAEFLGLQITAELAVRERASHSGCPYVQTQTKNSHAKEAPEAPTVLDNLKRIEDARKLYEQAEQERCAGRVGSACRKYEAIQRLCPGSRFDRQASRRLADMEAKLPNTSELSVEEEEDSAIGGRPSGPQVHCKLRIGVMDLTMNLQDGDRWMNMSYIMEIGAVVDCWDEIRIRLPIIFAERNSNKPGS